MSANVRIPYRVVCAVVCEHCRTIIGKYTTQDRYIVTRMFLSRIKEKKAVVEEDTGNVYCGVKCQLQHHEKLGLKESTTT